VKNKAPSDSPKGERGGGLKEEESPLHATTWRGFSCNVEKQWLRKIITPKLLHSLEKKQFLYSL
jgi:hypothetical protein